MYITKEACIFSRDRPVYYLEAGHISKEGKYISKAGPVYFT
jgi:hypothetical protein